MVRARAVWAAASVSLALLAVWAAPAHATMPVAPNELKCTIVGTSRNDILIGTSRNDVICGLDGDDEIWGLGGDDSLYGGAGGDTVHGGAGRDRLIGGSGVDRLDGGRGRDVVVRDREDFLTVVSARPSYAGLPVGSRVVFQGPGSVPSACLSQLGTIAVGTVPESGPAATFPVGLWQSRCAVTADWNVKVILPSGQIRQSTMTFTLLPPNRVSVACSVPDLACAAESSHRSAGGIVIDVTVAAGS
jgi:hypothetical protein